MKPKYLMANGQMALIVPAGHEDQACRVVVFDRHGRWVSSSDIMVPQRAEDEQARLTGRRRKPDGTPANPTDLPPARQRRLDFAAIRCLLAHLLEVGHVSYTFKDGRVVNFLHIHGMF